MRACGKIFFVLLGAFFFYADTAFAADKLRVFVSILPQKYFARQIGKEHVDVHVMVLPGTSPATYEPKPRQMADLSKAKVYFAIGVPFEKVWLKKIAAANPGMKVVHTDQGIKKIPMGTHRHPTERTEPGANGRRKKNHGPGQRHHPTGELDPHIWLSPPLVKAQARTILTALVAIDPSHREAYKVNYRAFMAAVDALHADLKAALAEKQGRHFMVFHPSWGYFARTYGLIQVPIEIEGKAPKPAQLKNLIKQARALDVKVVFVQPQFSTRSAERIAREIGGEVVFADPLAENWVANLKEVVEKLKTALR